MELIPGEKVSNSDRVCKTTLTHATSPKVFFEYHYPLLRRKESLTGRASFASNSVYLYLGIPIPYLNPSIERASCSSIHVYTYEFLSLSPIIAAKQLCQAASGGMFPYST